MGLPSMQAGGGSRLNMAIQKLLETIQAGRKTGLNYSYEFLTLARLIDLPDQSCARDARFYSVI
jgi:hypothetical protein